MDEKQLLFTKSVYQSAGLCFYPFLMIIDLLLIVCSWICLDFPANPLLIQSLKQARSLLLNQSLTWSNFTRSSLPKQMSKLMVTQRYTYTPNQLAHYMVALCNHIIHYSCLSIYIKINQVLWIGAWDPIIKNIEYCFSDTLV